MLGFEMIRNHLFLFFGVFRTEISLHEALFRAISFYYLGKFSITLIEFGYLSLLSL